MMKHKDETDADFVVRQLRAHYEKAERDLFIASEKTKHALEALDVAERARDYLAVHSKEKSSDLREGET